MESRGTTGGVGTVLVLGGGGARGAAQVGVLRALAARGISPDACVGTSVGALNAAVCAARPLPEAVRLLETIWASPETSRVLRRRALEAVLNQIRRRPYLRGNDDMRALVRRALELAGVAGFDDLRLPLHVVMTDLHAGEKVVASDGDLHVVLCASTAIPGVYPPVRVGDRLCVDGGVTENCSLATAAALDPARIIAIDLTYEEPPLGLRRFGEVLDRMRTVALQSRLAADFERFRNRIPVTLICPRPTRSLRAPQFTDLVALRDLASTAAERLLQGITAPNGGLEPGLYYLPIGVDTGA